MLLALVSCKNIQPGDLAGTWMLEDASRQVLPPELQKAPAKIVLNTNGTFVASAMPRLFEFPGHPMRLEAGRGVWQLVSREGEQHVQLNFQVIENWKDGLPYGAQLFVSRNSLVYFLGDPDEQRGVAFQKH